MSNLDSKQTSKAWILHMVSIPGCHFQADFERKIHLANNIIQMILMFLGNLRSNCRAAIEGLCCYLKFISILSLRPPKFNPGRSKLKTTVRTAVMLIQCCLNKCQWLRADRLQQWECARFAPTVGENLPRSGGLT